MKPALYIGIIRHRRYVPKPHSFRYPFFMWFFNLDEMAGTQDAGWWFSKGGFALSRFQRSDYLGPEDEGLHLSVKKRMAEKTGVPVTGHVCGLINLRTLGVYFSPVNFYFGYTERGRCSHFLAEVSNIPWNERHQYAFFLGGEQETFDNPKAFHVSPFNPIDQHYTWHIEAPENQVNIGINVDDHRGRVFEANLELTRHPLTPATIRRQLLRRPAMTISVVAAIYWQAFRLFAKGVPYVPHP